LWQIHLPVIFQMDAETDHVLVADSGFSRICNLPMRHFRNVEQVRTAVSSLEGAWFLSDSQATYYFTSKNRIRNAGRELADSSVRKNHRITNIKAACCGNVGSQQSKSARHNMGSGTNP